MRYRPDIGFHCYTCLTLRRSNRAMTGRRSACVILVQTTRIYRPSVLFTVMKFSFPSLCSRPVGDRFPFCLSLFLSHRNDGATLTLHVLFMKNTKSRTNVWPMLQMYALLYYNSRFVLLVLWTCPSTSVIHIHNLSSHFCLLICLYPCVLYYY